MARSAINKPTPKAAAPTPYAYVASGGVSNTQLQASEGDATLEDLYEAFREPLQLDDAAATYHASTKREKGNIKKRLPYFVGGTFKSSKRQDDDVQARTLLTLDVEQGEQDDGLPPSPQTVVKRLEEMGGSGWIYTSLSHTARAPRYRVVLPLDNAIRGDAAAMSAALKDSTLAAAKKLGIDAWTQSESWGLSQPMYLPAKLKGATFYQKHVRGKQWKVATGTPASVGQPADIPDHIDDDLSALKSAGLYRGEDPKHKGKHYIKCPFHALHGTENPTQTVFFEAHHDGNPRPAVKCFDTSPDVGGVPHLTYKTLRKELRRGYQFPDDDIEQQAKPLEDPAAFLARTGVAEMLVTEPVPLEFAIEGLAPLGMVTVLAGPGGVSKSALALRLLFSVSTGSHFGDFEIRAARRCLYITYEDDLRTFHGRFKTIYEDFSSRGHNLLYTEVEKNLHIEAVGDSGDSWVLMKKDGKFGTPTATPAANQLREILLRGRIQLLVLDPAVYAHSLDENSNGDMAPFMQMLGRLAREADCAILLLHHTNKGSEAAGKVSASQGSLRGASAISANARSVATMFDLTKDEAAQYDGIPCDDNAPRDYAVVSHVKSNHAANFGKRVFRRDGVLLEPVKLNRLAPEIVREVKAKAHAQKTAQNAEQRALEAIRYIANPKGNNNRPMKRGDVALFFKENPDTTSWLKYGESKGWLVGVKQGTSVLWTVTSEGRAIAVL